jgi:hypothetical protein
LLVAAVVEAAWVHQVNFRMVVVRVVPVKWYNDSLLTSRLGKVFRSLLVRREQAASELILTVQ